MKRPARKPLKDQARIAPPRVFDKPAFLNCLRSLFNIDGDLLPELTREEQTAFVTDPVRYLMRANDDHAVAIWREVEKRQRSAR